MTLTGVPHREHGITTGSQTAAGVTRPINHLVEGGVVAPVRRPNRHRSALSATIVFIAKLQRRISREIQHGRKMGGAKGARERPTSGGSFADAV
jgi:hypothetical protein